MTEPGGLWRVRYTGKPAHLPAALAVRKDGLEIGFTDPLDRASAEDAANYAVLRWNYQWTQNYGSKQYSIETPGKVGQDTVEVVGAALSADGRTVTLKLADVRPAMQMKIELNLKSEQGGAVKHVIHSTVNKVPQ